jgi:hypothetical protein
MELNTGGNGFESWPVYWMSRLHDLHTSLHGYQDNILVPYNRPLPHLSKSVTAQNLLILFHLIPKYETILVDLASLKSNKWKTTIYLPRATDFHDSQSRQTVKYGTRNQEWLCWRGPETIYPTRAIDTVTSVRCLKVYSHSAG